MSGAPLPTFIDGEFPFADQPPRECYWCRGETHAVWTSDGVDGRRCASAIELVCNAIPSDLAAVIMDRVAETHGSYMVAVRVTIHEPSTLFVHAGLRPRWIDRVLGAFEVRIGGSVSRNGEPLEVRDHGLSAICWAPPTRSQHLAHMLMHDPEIDAALRHIREPNERAQAERDAAMRSALRNPVAEVGGVFEIPWEAYESGDMTTPTVLSGESRWSDLIDGQWLEDWSDSSSATNQEP